VKKPYDTDSPFIQELQSGTTLNVNGSPMPTAIWNLIISKRDISNYVRIRGMKPHRNWKITDVKRYFGIKGTGEALLDRFLTLYADVMGDDE